MMTIETLRGYAVRLPEVVETGDAGTPVFSVAGVGFLRIEASGSTAVVAVDEYEAGALVAGHQDLYEEVWEEVAGFVGLRVDLARAPEQRLRDLDESAWRNKAPEHLAGARG
jgi:hypothetical protein